MFQFKRVKKAIPPKTTYTSAAITQADREKWLADSIKERELWDYKLGDTVFIRSTDSFGEIIELNFTLTANAISYGQRLDTVKVQMKGNAAYSNYSNYSTWYSVFEIYKQNEEGKPLYTVDTRGNQVKKPIDITPVANQSWTYEDEVWHHGIGS